MENTCNKDCPLWKKHKDKCPNYMVTHWKDEHSNTEKRLEDCVPRRTLLQLQTIHNLLIGLQKTSNAERNASNALAYVLMEGIRYSSENPGKLKISLPEPKDESNRILTAPRTEKRQIPG